jgi:four helix bundle protein
MDLVVDIYRSATGFPKDELFGLTSQIKRAAASIPANIAEGFNRYHNKEYAHFLYIALGSCSELETHLEVSHRLNFISNQVKDKLIGQIIDITKMTRGLIKKINERG